MLVSNGEEKILLSSENETEISKSDSVDGLLPVSTVYTDVGVVPEQQKNELEHFISNLQREVEELRVKQRIVDEKRREALSKILDIKGSIRVFCRIRPNHLTEKRRNSEPVSAGSERIRVKLGGTRKDFEFDKVFPQETSQESVFVEVEPILRSAMDGHNVCVFAYAALKRKKCHVPYRNSKLTQLLRDSLGDGSKVLMLVHISPSEEDVCETVCSLNFAKRARAIESNREVPMELKKQREKKIMELEDDIKEAEKQRQSLRDQIQNIELKLSENKKLFSTIYSLQESDDLVTSASLKDDFKEVIETPKTSKKNIQRSVSNSVPRFMSSTVASRHRQIASEQEIGGRTKSLRSVVTRSSIQFPCSQSLSYSDLRIKTILRSSTGKSRYAETNNVPNTESPKCNESESKVITPRSTTVTSSDSNLRSTLYHHRRRMSNLI
ncbi:hypothetical protein P8452_09132 [Trifolium repens]|nr:hypothetical protein P8452_09132 [Trifolium repens]